MKPNREWASELVETSNTWATPNTYAAIVRLIRLIRLEAINAAADLVRETKEEGADELATAIVETLTRSMQ